MSRLKKELRPKMDDEENENFKNGSDSSSSDSGEDNFVRFTSQNKFAALAKKKSKIETKTTAQQQSAAALLPKRNLTDEIAKKLAALKVEEKPPAAAAASLRGRADSGYSTKENSLTLRRYRPFPDVYGEREAIPFPEFLHRYEVHLACPFCYDASKNTVKLMSHVCNYSTFLCRRRVEEEEQQQHQEDIDYKRPLDWKIVRELPFGGGSNNRHRLRLCSDIQHCIKGVDCPLAHSEIELEIWKDECKNGKKELSISLREILMTSTIIGSEKKAMLPTPFTDDLEKVVSIWLACSICATFVRKQYYVLRYWDHQCRSNIVFIKYDFKNPIQLEFWHFLRPSPMAAKRRHDFEFCRHLDPGCWRGYLCRFAHTKLESHLWELDKNMRFSLGNFLYGICRMGSTTEEKEWKPILFTDIDGDGGDRFMEKEKRTDDTNEFWQNDRSRTTSGRTYDSGGDRHRLDSDSMSADIAPPQSIERQRQTSSRSSTNTERKTSSIEYHGGGGGCPFNIQYICHSCFKKSGATVFQQGNYCASRSANHTWDQHKGFAILDKTGKAMLLRDLPYAICRAQKFGKPAIVRMCERIKKNGKCEVASNLCDYAHYELERRCWMWLIKSGKNLSDVVGRKPMVVEEKKAAVKSILEMPVTRPGAAWTWGPNKPKTVTAPRTINPVRAVMPPPPLVPLTSRRLVPRGRGVPVSSILPPPGFSPPSRSTSAAVPPPPQPRLPPIVYVMAQELEDTSFYCYLCDKRLPDLERFDEHLKVEIHKERFNLVEEGGPVWRYRVPVGPPPFQLCKSHINGEKCVYSKTDFNRCTNAHSMDELDEWHERLDFMKGSLNRKSSEEMKKLQSFINDAKKSGKSILSSCLDDVEIQCLGPEVKRVDKGEQYVWKYSIAAEKRLVRVILLDHDSSLYFRLRSPFSSTNGEEIEMGDAFADETLEGLYEIWLEFIGSNTPQTFTQRVAFDFGQIPIVYREVVICSGIDHKEFVRQQSLRYLLSAPSDRWTPENSNIIWISKEKSTERMEIANVVANLNFTINESNYFSLLKQWLFAEEYKRQSILDELHFNGALITAVPIVIDDGGYELRPGLEGTFFAEMPLKEILSEDIDVINLLRDDCLNAFVSSTVLTSSGAGASGDGNQKRYVYEVDVVNKLTFKADGVFSDRVHLRLSQLFVRHKRLQSGSKIKVDVQFNLYSKPFRQWLRGLERLQERQLAPLIFPDLRLYYNDYALGKVFTSSRPKMVGLEDLKAQLEKTHNSEQRFVIEHVLLCAVDLNSWLPPLVVFGPFGTGKTRTIAAAAACLLTNPRFEHTKILICTHANTTADMYINLLMAHTKMNARQLASILWRVVNRRSTFESEQFMRFEWNPITGQNRPKRLTAAELKKIRIVLCTFTASDKLLKVLDTDENEQDPVAFTHIFIDEAAQALELETVLPLCLAKRSTCVVVAGDHHQIRPPVYLPQAKELSRSYLERLYYFYDKQKNSMTPEMRAAYRFPSILFNKNYRCHPQILSFLSSQFYGDEKCLMSCVEKYDDNVIKPLYFVATESDEEIGRNASICNTAEARAVTEQVEYLCYNWPKSWGEVNIGVAVPYVEQGKIIREMLKERRISTHRSKVDVSRVIEMQGKEYKALIISTVRGPTQLQASIEAAGKKAGSIQNLSRNLAFLDDTRLINTAMTRAKYTVIVVGNPIVLCALGTCRNIWYRYIEECAQKQTLLPFSIKWAELDEKINLVRADKENLNKTKNETTTNTDTDDLLIQQLTKKTNFETKNKK